MNIGIAKALRVLTPKSEWVVRDEDYTKLVWIKENGYSKPTEEEINAKIIELQAEYDAQEYARKRKAEYPTIEELVVALYDTDDKAAVDEKRAAVKLKYPKL
tara:strand:- start:407 stop:712 length:306 start_codon:yes stop_codon:yes gene_type:complete